MNKEILEFREEFFKTFSNAKRLEIFDLLKEGEMTVDAIAGRLKIPKTNVSQHLTLMRKMRILKTRRDGRNIYYRIANDKLIEACTLMHEALEQIMKSV
ncbi:MAG: metalloregulator ArsR/SmtB family transcription factor [Nitrospirota bacterium]